MKRQSNMTLKNELPRSVGVQYAVRKKAENSSRRNEESEPKQEKHALVIVSGGENLML